MSLDPSTVIHAFDSGSFFDVEQAIAQLLLEEILFANGRPYAMSKGEPSSGETIVLFVNCSDVFVWGCADGEDLPYEEIEPLYRLVLAHGHAGKEKWCCMRRNTKPQACVARDMKAAGAWDDKMEALPENAYDKYCQEQVAKQAKEVI